MGLMHLTNVDFFDLGLNELPTMIFNNVPLFDKISGLKLLSFCEQHSIIVLGIEGFRVDNGFRIPIMECIADFSSVIDNCSDLSKITVQLAQDFINANGEECQMIEFVLCREGNSSL